MRPRGQKEDGEEEQSYSVSPEVEVGKSAEIVCEATCVFLQLLKSLA